MDLLDALNDEQRAAVELTEGYVSLHAGAGTGKTRTLTYRYAYLISELGISPKSVWCVTFTNKAANEMKQRVQKLCGNAIGNPFVTTFHGFCALFLREEIMNIGWPKTFTIADVNDVKEILRPLYKECEIDGKKLSLKKAWNFIDGQKENKDYIPAFIGANTANLLERSQESEEDNLKLFWRYLFAQRTTYTVDFDDLILLTLHILKNFPEVRERWQKRLEYILVDEFQDIDRDQYELVEILASRNNNLFIVGDPDQTIYSFRGARVEYFKGFSAKHSNAHKLNLTYNYRSQANILQAAYSVISNNVDPERLPLKALRTDITINDMVAVCDPNLKVEDKLSDDVAAKINQKAYLPQGMPSMPVRGSRAAQKSGRGARYSTNPGLMNASQAGLNGLFGANDGSLGAPMYDRLSNTVGYKKEHKLQRLGLIPRNPQVEGEVDDPSWMTNPNLVSPFEDGSLGYGDYIDADDDTAAVVISESSEDGQVYQAVPVEQVQYTQQASEIYGPNYGANSAANAKSAPPVWTMKPLVINCKDVYTEADFVGDTVAVIRQHDPNASIAVLYRAHYIALNIENAFVARRIPYGMVGDLRFFDRKEIRDVIAYMRLRVNLDDDVAFRRVINTPSRGFGKKRMEHLEQIAHINNCSLFRALAVSSHDTFLYDNKGRMAEFVSVMTNLASSDFRAPIDDFELILNNTGYEEWIKQGGEDERLENIASLKNYLNDFKKNQDDEVNIADFISNVSLMTQIDGMSGENKVNMMTVHNAKGLEFDYVFVVSLNESIFPSRKSVNELAVEEERRLMYVAMTRAKKQLFLTEAGGTLVLRTASDKQVVNRTPSRFLTEMKSDDYEEVGGSLAQMCIECEHYFNFEAKDDNRMAVGERFFHKILGYGVVREVRLVEGEYLVFYEKIKKERTLSFTAKFERVAASEDAPGQEGAKENQETNAEASADVSNLQGFAKAQAQAQEQIQAQANEQGNGQSTAQSNTNDSEQTKDTVNGSDSEQQAQQPSDGAAVATPMSYSDFLARKKQQEGKGAQDNHKNMSDKQAQEGAAAQQSYGYQQQANSGAKPYQTNYGYAGAYSPQSNGAYAPAQGYAQNAAPQVANNAAPPYAQNVAQPSVSQQKAASNGQNNRASPWGRSGHVRLSGQDLQKILQRQAGNNAQEGGQMPFNAQNPAQAAQAVQPQQMVNQAYAPQSAAPMPNNGSFAPMVSRPSGIQVPRADKLRGDGNAMSDAASANGSAKTYGYGANASKSGSTYGVPEGFSLYSNMSRAQSREVFAGDDDDDDWGE